MKNQLLKLTWIAIFGFLGVCTSFGQTILETDQILVRTYELAPGGIYSSEIVISYGDERIEKIDLGSLRPKDWEFNTFTINKVLNNIRKAGYKLSSSNAGSGSTILITTYVFVKGDDVDIEE